MSNENARAGDQSWEFSSAGNLTIKISPVEWRCKVHGPQPIGQLIQVSLGNPELDGQYCMTCFAEHLVKVARLERLTAQSKDDATEAGTTTPQGGVR